MDNTHYPLANSDAIPSPSLLVYRDLVRANIQHAIATAGGPERLRPHVKTHKSAEIVRLEHEAGILKHKCATLREAEMLAEEGITDIVIAYPMLGPNVARFLGLMGRFPQVVFRPTVDDSLGIDQLSDAATERGLLVPVLVDLDMGSHRTGTSFDRAEQLYERLDQSPGVTPVGLHAYDGPTRDTDPEARCRRCGTLYRQVDVLRQTLRKKGLPVELVVMGGTPSFPGYARIPDVEASPGTFVLHDHGYASRFPDLGFTPAAMLLTRVICVATQGWVTLDLGHKAIAADANPRGVVWQHEGWQPDAQSEEHWMFQLTDGAEPRPGDVLLVRPGHICPTVALHARMIVIDGRGEWVDTWMVRARGRWLATEISQQYRIYTADDLISPRENTASAWRRRGIGPSRGTSP